MNEQIALNDFEKEISEIVEKMMSEKNLKDHGFDHVKRDVTYGKMILTALSIKDSAFDIIAALYCHDLGRRNNGIDKHHGKRGADIFTRAIYPKFTFLDKTTVAFTIANHQVPPSDKTKFPLVWSYEIPSGLNQIVPMVVWDADRLDLPRIEKFKGKINANYLHTEFAKKFANTAEHLRMYT